jgi:hypothetical protein
VFFHVFDLIHDDFLEFPCVFPCLWSYYIESWSQTQTK